MPDDLPPLSIAFYAPLKAPDHPVPSGDRLMARMLVAALRAAGHRVAVVSDLRAFRGDPEDGPGWIALQQAAAAERDRIAADWRERGQPDLWFCYHPYYKAPDLLGPPLAVDFAVPMVTCEASYSARRNIGIWVPMQAAMLSGLRAARLNLCLTARDHAGLAAVDPNLWLAMLPPFIDTGPFAAPPAPEPGHLVTVAMMRAGDKATSYARLAAALRRLPPGLPWHLTVAGDGPLRDQVRAMFEGLPAGRVTWAGQVPRDGVARLLARGMVHVWPGYGEAYGLAYLEAQAAGLPVVACRTAGVPEVVADGLSGVLVPPGDDDAMARAIAGLLTDPAAARAMGQAARARVAERHAFPVAARRLDGLLQTALGR
ncbi:MAG: glycosyltransferase family 4 protein [Gemmobacter sp.]